MKNITSRFPLLLAAALCLTACVGEQKERDFDFTLQMDPLVLQGDRAVAHLGIVSGSPLDGYEPTVTIDGSKADAPAVITFSQEGRYDLDLTDSPLLTLGNHTLSVTLKYNTSKTRTADFLLGRNADEISGVESAYSVVCTDTLRVRPVISPQPNTDTLRYEVTNASGDYIKVLEEADGVLALCTEHGKAAGCGVRLWTNLLEKTFTVDFHIIAATAIEGLDAEYTAKCTEAISVRPTLLPADCMETLSMTVDDAQGDELLWEKAEDGTWTFRTAAGQPCEALVSFAVSAVRRTVPLHFFAPVKEISGIDREYETHCADELCITPLLLPSNTTEKAGVEVLSTEGDNLRVDTLTSGAFRFKTANGAPGLYTVRFVTSEASAQTTLAFYEDIDVWVDEGALNACDVRLRYGRLPAIYECKPRFRVGVEDCDGELTLLRYSDGTDKPDVVKSTYGKSVEDAEAAFVQEGDWMVWYDNSIATAYHDATADAGLAPDFHTYYIYRQVRHVVFVEEVSDCYRIHLKAGDAVEVGVYMYYPDTYRPFKYYNNVCGFAEGSREECLKLHDAAWYCNEVTAKNTRVLW